MDKEHQGSIYDRDDRDDDDDESLPELTIGHAAHDLQKGVCHSIKEQVLMLILCLHSHDTS